MPQLRNPVAGVVGLVAILDFTEYQSGECGACDDATDRLLVESPSTTAVFEKKLPESDGQSVGDDRGENFSQSVSIRGRKSERSRLIMSRWSRGRHAGVRLSVIDTSAVQS
jgi:hypothetical protein